MINRKRANVSPCRTPASISKNSAPPSQVDLIVNFSIISGMKMDKDLINVMKGPFMS